MWKVLVVSGSVKEVVKIQGVIGDEYSFYLAADVQQALKCFIVYNPDIILVDPELEEGRGLSLIKEFSQRKKIVMALSAKGKISNIEKAMAGGARCFLLEPVIPEIVAERIKSYMNEESEKFNSAAI